MTSKTTTAGSDADRQAVLDVLARLYQAWEAGDAETFVADYTEDASVIQLGVYEKDREEIRTNAGQARRRLAHRLLPQQPRQLRRSLPGTGRLPSGGAAPYPDPNGFQGRGSGWHGRDRQSKTVWTWSAERKEP
jgi:hypothetical protein